MQLFLQLLLWWGNKMLIFYLQIFLPTFFTLKIILSKRMSTKFWVVPQKAIFFLNRPEDLEYMQYSFMLQMIQKTGDFYSDKTNWEVARWEEFTIQCLTFHFQYAWNLFSTKAGTAAEIQVPNSYYWLLWLEESLGLCMSKSHGRRKQCIAKALGKKDSGEGKEFLWRKGKRHKLECWH